VTFLVRTQKPLAADLAARILAVSIRCRL